MCWALPLANLDTFFLRLADPLTVLEALALNSKPRVCKNLALTLDACWRYSGTSSQCGEKHNGNNDFHGVSNLQA